MADIRLKNITKIFDSHVIGLKDFDLEVRNGEFVTILGPSGSGKTTALRIVAGLERQDRGDLFIDGNNISELPPQARDVAFVFQSYALYPHMDVYENIAVGLRLKGYPINEIKKRVKEVTDLLEIGHLLKRKPKALSGGQRQRVALARAIAKRPKVFLLDEPLSNLDAMLRERMRTELKTLFRRLNATVIYVTHDQNEAMSLSDKIALIDKGALKQTGSPDELYYHPQDLFVATFLGSPRINTIEVTIEGEKLICGSMRWEVPEDRLDKVKDLSRLILGIRPEDIRVHLDQRPNTIKTKVFTVEKLGKYAILSLNWQSRIIKVLAEREVGQRLTEDDNVWMEFDMAKSYLFNVDTQKVSFSD